MKRLTLFLLAPLLLIGCSRKPQPPEPTSSYGLVLQGDHLLRQVSSFRGTDGSIEGSYFLFIGDVRGTTTETYKVTFAWQGNDGAYRYTTLPLEKVLVVPDAHIGKPFVKFRWARYDGEILYAVFGVNPKDWPEKIEMPLGK